VVLIPCSCWADDERCSCEPGTGSYVIVMSSGLGDSVGPIAWAASDLETSSVDFRILHGESQHPVGSSTAARRSTQSSMSAEAPAAAAAISAVVLR
jgi:hypothetical protein